MTIKIEASDKVFSAHGGLVLFNRACQRMHLREDLLPGLPQLASGAGRSWDKFHSLMAGFFTGASCLDDMAIFAQDAGFAEAATTYSPKAFGDFLRSFSHLDIRTLQARLIDTGFKLRSTCHFERSITFDFDSTTNQQYGIKMEGVEQNYKGIDCLDTFQVFDELGFQYWNEVRPGNTASASEVSLVIHNLISRMPKTKFFKRLRLYARADSAFCNREFFNACAAKEVGFVCTMRQNMFQPLLDQILDWVPTNLGKENRIRFYDGRECEIGETLYKPDGGAEVLRVVAIRALKKEVGRRLFYDACDYDYYAWVSNIGEHELSSEKLIKFYRRRGNAENYIRELKYGFDLKHYPCLKLDANRVYGLIAGFAYNIMRLIALKANASRPQFAKAIRHRFVHLAVQVIRHGRQVIFRFCRSQYEEVSRWLKIISNIEFGFA